MCFSDLSLTEDRVLVPESESLVEDNEVYQNEDEEDDRDTHTHKEDEDE